MKRGTKGRREARAQARQSGHSVSLLISTIGFEIERFSIWRSTASCDLVKHRISDITCDRKVQTSDTVVQQKTGGSVRFKL